MVRTLVNIFMIGVAGRAVYTAFKDNNHPLGFALMTMFISAAIADMANRLAK